MVSKCNVEGEGGFRIALPRTRQISVKSSQMPFFGLALFLETLFRHGKPSVTNWGHYYVTIY